MERSCATDALASHVELAIGRSGLAPERREELRQELLGHLKDSVYRERVLGATEEKAVATALAAFGDPAVIRARLRVNRLRSELRRAARLPGALLVLMAADALCLVVWLNREVLATSLVGLRRESLLLLILAASTVAYWACAAGLMYSMRTLAYWRRHHGPAIEAVVAAAVTGVSVALWFTVRPGIVPAFATSLLRQLPAWCMLIDGAGTACLLLLVLGAGELGRQLWPARGAPR